MWRRLSLWLLSGLSLVVLLLVTATPLLAENSVRVSAPGPSADPGLELPVGAELQSGVRSMPLVPVGGVVDRRFDGGRGLTDADAIRAALLSVGAEIGLDSKTVSALLSTSPSHGDGYPYAYEPYDTVVARNLAVPAGDVRPVIDFATLAIALAQRSNDSGTGQWGAALAYSVLNRARRGKDTCDLQTELTYLVGLGLESAYADVASEAARADALCTEDPTPTWLLAKFAATQATVSGEFRQLEGTAQQRRELAEQAFAQLRRDHPGSPVGWAGAADLDLDWANEAEQFGAEPFQVRRWREQAAELYHQVRQRFSDPRLAVGHARALSELGEHARAVELIDRAVERLPASLPAAIVRSDVLSRSGDHARAAAAIADERPVPAWWVGERPLFRPQFLTGAYGDEEWPELEVSDASSEGGFGGGGVDDLGFIPHDRFGRSDSYCRTGKRLEELLLAHADSDVTTLIATGARPTEVVRGLDCADPETEEVVFTDQELRVFAALDSDGSAAAPAELRDRWQDLLRSADQWDRARAACEAWTATQPANASGWQRLGEVAFLTHDDTTARTSFEKAGALPKPEDSDPPLDAWYHQGSEQTALAQLQRGAVDQRAGRPRDAAEWYERSIATARTLAADDQFGVYVQVHAHSQLGRAALIAGRFDDAVTQLSAAVALGRPYDEIQAEKGPDVDPPRDGPLPTENLGQNDVLHGAQENNLALAYAHRGLAEEAVASARNALARDPESPIFLDTLAFALQSRGGEQDAIALYRAALARDASSYASANNLAVLLAQEGRPQEAQDVFDAILATQPGYGLAWHNLGVLDQGTWSLSAYLRSQGELGRGALLSKDLRTVEPELVTDDVVYDSGVDVSKPLPADWAFARTASVPATHWTTSLVALLVIRIVLLLLNELAGGRFSEWLLQFHEVRQGTWVTARVACTIAAIATILMLTGRHALLQPSVASTVLLLALASMVVFAVALRSLREPAGRQSTTPLAVGVAAVSAVLGFPFAPFPSLEPTGGSVRRLSLWIAPAVAGTVLVVSTALLGLTGAPLARLMALAALTLLGSIFVAVPPMDGARIEGRLINIAVSLVLLIGALAYGLPLV